MKNTSKRDGDQHLAIYGAALGTASLPELTRGMNHPPSKAMDAGAVCQTPDIFDQTPARPQALVP